MEKIDKRHYCIIFKWNDDGSIKKLKTKGGFNHKKFKEDKKKNFKFFNLDPAFHGFRMNINFESP